MNQEKLTTSAWSLAVLVVFLLLWEYLPGWLGVPQFVLPPLSQVLAEAGRIWEGERLLWHAGITAAEVVIGFALGSLLGAVIGYALGISPRIEAILSPYLLALQIAPKVAFAPLFVMWLGYTIYPKILVAVLIVFFPVLINVLSAMRAMDGDLINLARSFSATRFQVFRMVEFPTTLPPLFSGLRIASTLAVIGVVVGELVGGNMGLGYLLVFFEGQGNTSGVFVVIGALTVIGILAYYAVVLAEKRVLHYLVNAQRPGA
ncbi:ABC transporter permease [Limnohabitans sp. 2KL-1]|jgi:NitT/TauT family transport system permease protein|uniref:ABC transporter permease n=1 Tax=Limnohabitans sp. 2KL-1 TaxID=1100699 RepID=UPI000D392499|nr:ABC transporter permease [Limnohabitans sp. 2KL-1]PUE47999.1 ABC transporter permease [Limnohabitans sp. 2KL-1]